MATLFVHSTGTGPFMWDSIGAPGEGTRLTPANLGYPPLPELARGTPFSLQHDLRHLEGQLLPVTEPLDVVAHSYGGLLAIKLAQRLGKRVRSMFLLEPVMFGAIDQDPEASQQAKDELGRFLTMKWFIEDQARGGTAEWLEIFIDYWNRPGSWARIPEFMREHSLAVGWKMFQEVRSVFLESGTYADNVLPSVPVTLVEGDRSPLGSREVIRGLSRRHPHATVAVLTGTGHMAPLTHPAKVSEALAAHFASLPR